MIGEKVGKYTILEIVGSGNMGSVYKAEDPEGRLFAVKVVRSQVLCSMEKRERFLQCLLVASEIRHAGICPILEIGDDHDDFFIIMLFEDFFIFMFFDDIFFIPLLLFIIDVSDLATTGFVG